MPLANSSRSVVEKLRAYFAWAKEDARVAGIHPWHFNCRGPPGQQGSFVCIKDIPENPPPWCVASAARPPGRGCVLLAPTSTDHNLEIWSQQPAGQPASSGLHSLTARVRVAAMQCSDMALGASDMPDVVAELAVIGKYIKQQQQQQLVVTRETA